jgi:hypothetical protein
MAMRQSPSGLDVRAELWRSFVSLLRSYAAAASLNGLEHGVLVLTENSLQVVAVPGTLSVAFYQALGRGVWSIAVNSELEKGTFELHLDGTVLLDDRLVDMDHAAIELISWLSRAANRNPIEVLA